MYVRPEILGEIEEVEMLEKYEMYKIEFNKFRNSLVANRSVFNPTIFHCFALN